MRSPVLAFSIIAATVSPTLIAAAPASPIPGFPNPVDNVHQLATRQISPGSTAPVEMLANTAGATSGSNSGGPRSEAKANRHQSKAAQDRRPHPNKVQRRAYDGYTAGGNAHSGGSANASGGNIGNFSEDPGAPLINNASNAAGNGDISATGDGIGGNGDGFGPGGNGSSGNAANSRGGDIVNEGRGGVTNTGPGANTVGTGGFSGSGDAIGGSAGGFRKRAFDYGTAGGNSYSGASSSTSSGSVSNVADPDSDVTNTANSNIGPDVVTAGDGGPTSESFSGTSVGGDGDGFGPGGNAYSGAAGPSNGGFVFNEGDDITNTASNDAVNGGVSDSGPAFGGNAGGFEFDDLDRRRSLHRRAYNDYTGGGNAVSGNSGAVDGGNIINDAGPENDITNTDGNVAGDAGTSFSGEAIGGDGEGRGPGGNAYSGYTGSTRGGTVINSAGTIENTAGANTGGNGNTNISGDAIGGDAGGVGPFSGDGVDDFDAAMR
ncbi:hypothetical protein EIP91_002397 [Steccherinum ochraceum]|uniref:Uncharacterized protein n=1 Tax=Steccherinum ochraceum TaxID=92696 RepID=A0A4R0RTG8_9APHY|nr:hypothetical protein EIP91_002397 [Steccherinum ochraceum]